LQRNIRLRVSQQRSQNLRFNSFSFHRNVQRRLAKLCAGTVDEKQHRPVDGARVYLVRLYHRRFFGQEGGYDFRSMLGYGVVQRGSAKTTDLRGRSEKSTQRHKLLAQEQRTVSSAMFAFAP
jgi:hypothetical protein